MVVGGRNPENEPRPKDPATGPQGSGIPGKRGRFRLLDCSTAVKPDLATYSSSAGGTERRAWRAGGGASGDGRTNGSFRGLAGGLRTSRGLARNTVK